MLRPAILTGVNTRGSLMSRSHHSFPARTWQVQEQFSGRNATAAAAPPLFSNAASSGISSQQLYTPAFIHSNS